MEGNLFCSFIPEYPILKMLNGCCQSIDTSRKYHPQVPSESKDIKTVKSFRGSRVDWDMGEEADRKVQDAKPCSVPRSFLHLYLQGSPPNQLKV
jgi:hypothetical protein